MTAVASGVFRHPVPDVSTPDSCFIRGWTSAKNCFLSGADEKHRKVVHQACFFHPVTNTKLQPQFPDVFDATEASLPATKAVDRCSCLLDLVDRYFAF